MPEFGKPFGYPGARVALPVVGRYKPGSVRLHPGPSASL